MISSTSTASTTSSKKYFIATQEKYDELSGNDEELPSLVKHFREFERDEEEDSEDELSKDLPKTSMS